MVPFACIDKLRHREYNKAKRIPQGGCYAKATYTERGFLSFLRRVVANRENCVIIKDRIRKKEGVAMKIRIAFRQLAF